jgi:hypothetical protein
MQLQSYLGSFGNASTESHLAVASAFGSATSNILALSR